ncbi:WD40/YVTN/BNR-like repeat-containing protein [Carboxylicivirga sp. RSCT41]|uniref:WD40/YVTN/BNR-like repeat-containing protein n=1 Tax=Carboxylicivirga agarovorans TaxID=3417570 RepID=UPI003D3508EB
MKRTVFLLVALMFATTIFGQERPDHFDAMSWRFIGPIVGNRGSVTIGHPTEPHTFYHGASNGLWKTEDAGTYWEPVGDEYFKYGSIGAMEFSDSNPNIAYVGTGEPQMRNNVSWGDGVYKTTDNGKTWTNVGLENTKHISQVRVHPTNPDIVFVGAFGHAFGPNPDRGVFRTKDGGTTWEKVLYKSDRAGCIDLVMNPSNPDELFAVIWEFERKAWGPKTGGPESGLWRSLDGGDTWTEITYNDGLPDKGRGRTGITMSAADAKRVYALIDSETKPGLYVSNDLGDNWEFVSDFFQIIGRPFYYSHIYASPHDANELWSPNNRMFMTKDGGKNWILDPGIKDDFHDIWICPKDPMRMIGSNDGGCQVSITGGKTWSSQHTQKNSQFYRVNVDNDFPYNVYGSGQDILAYKVPSASRWGGISGYETTIIGNGEISSVIPNPDDLNIVYNISGGAPMGSGAPFTVNNLATGQNEVRSVWPVPLFGLNGSDLKYRFNWDLAYFLSPHDNKTIYLGGNVLFKSTDEGLNWEVISPDLTNDLKDRQKITGTPWLSEYFGQEIYSTIKRMDESPVQQGVIWTGSDDGKVFITKDGGANWEDISIVDPALPQYSQVYEIEPSPHDAATAYVVYSNFNTYNDYKPYIFKTTDYGQTWTNLSSMFPQTEITRTIREDKVRKGLLFAGTETGVYYSLNDGQSWDKLKANLPAVPVVDMKIKDVDLVIATNGRGFWIMDDITPLREKSPETDGKAVHLYPIPEHTRFGYNWWLDYFPGGDPAMKKNYFVQNMRPGLTFYELTFKQVNGERKRQFIDAGDPKPLGPVFYFKLEQEPKDITIEILDKNGQLLRTYTKEQMMLNYGKDGDFNTGMNKFVWDMRINMLPRVPKRPPTAIIPIVPPGEYQVKLTVDGTVETQPFMIKMSPKETYSQAQAEAKYDFWMEMYEVAGQSTARIIEALETRDAALKKLEDFKQSGAKSGKIKDAQKQADEISRIVGEYESTFVSTGRTLAEVINLPATILFKMSFMSGILDHSEGPVTGSMQAEFKGLVEEAKKADQAYQENITPVLEKFNKVIN